MKIVTEQFNGKKTTQLSSKESSGEIIATTALDENRVFIVYSNNSLGTAIGIHGVVCTVSANNEIELSTDTILNTQSSEYLSVEKLAENLVTVVYTSGADSDIFVDIYEIKEDNSLIKKTSTNLGAKLRAAQSASILTTNLYEDKLYIAYTSGTYKYLALMVCTIRRRL